MVLDLNQSGLYLVKIYMAWDAENLTLECVCFSVVNMLEKPVYQFICPEVFNPHDYRTKHTSRC